MDASLAPPPGAHARPGRYFDPVVLARISNLTLRARHVVEGLMAGMHRSSLRGLSVEFAEHRPYTPGDELRRVDWKLFSRQDRYYVKEYEAETNLRAHLFVDASASMGYAGSGISKYDCAATLAASLAYLMLLQRDAVGLVVMGAGAPRVIPARSQPHHLHAIIAELEAARPAGVADVRAALADVAGRMHRRGLCILISDLLDDPQGLEQGLRHLHHRRNDLMVLHLADRDELELPFGKLTLFRDLEGALELTTDPREIRREYRAAMGEHLEHVRALCRRSGADYDLLVTDQPLDRWLVRFLARREG
jgi:uncharacterized protein (DUF58 family)